MTKPRLNPLQTTNKFHENVRILRKQRGWTLEKLSRLAQISKTYCWELENTKKSPGLDIVMRLADIFNVGLDHLVGVTPKVVCEKCRGSGYCLPEENEG